jgi:MoaA/NifB/PqqE/SkfB family radical SAM enzyme
VTFEIAKKIIEKAIEYHSHYGESLRVVLSGGEPLLYDETIDVIKLFEKNNIRVTLSTNGYLLLDKFPNYHEYLDVIALPLEGTKERNDRIRGTGHYEKVIKILENATSHQSKIKIETVVLPDTNIEDLNNLKEICGRFNVRSWKIFEYNHYPDRNDYCVANSIDFTADNPVIDGWFDENAESWIVYEKCANRNRRHFVVNPNGDIMIPEMIDGVFSDKLFFNVLVDFESCIQEWWKYCDMNEVVNHHCIMNNKEFGLYSDFV